MKTSRHEPHHVKYSTLAGSLALILLFAPAGRAQTAAKTSPVTRRFTTAEDTKRREELPFNSSCTPANFHLKLSENKFIRLEQSGSVFLRQAPTPVGFLIDATDLPPGEYSDVLTIECIDCQKSVGCSQVSYAVLLLLTVTPRPRAGSETGIPAAQVKAAIDAALAALAEEVERRIGRLKKINGRTEDGKNVAGYDAVEVQQLLAWVKLQVMAVFEREGLFAMRDYIEKNFQPSTLEIVRAAVGDARLVLPSRGGFSIPALGFGAGGGRPAEGLIATASSSTKAFKYVRGYIRFAIKNSGPRKLTVRSEPDLANVVLETRKGARSSFATNNDLSDFWPGLYSLTVTKSGFVPIVQGEVDLVLNDTIECTLAKTGEAIFCRIR